MTLIYNATFDKNTRKLAFEDKAGNEIYSFTVPERTPVDSVTKPLTFKATQNGSTVKLTKSGNPSGSFQTSTDGGNTWTDYTIDTAIALNTGDKVSFRAKADRTTDQNAQVYFYFMMEGKIEAWHNVMSLYRTSDFATYNTATQYSFNQLFEGCTSLTKAPVLPATSLANNCYVGMFEGCTSLTKAPALPATTLADYCYYNMFYGCSSLNEVSCQMPSTISEGDISASYTYDWLNGVSPTGTFYTNYDANWPSGASGIPENWTRVNEGAPSVDDITKPLTFKATQDGSTVKLSNYNTVNGAFQTSLDGGNTWSDYTLDTAITLNTGDKVSFRAKSDRTSKEYSGVYFKMTGEIEAWHNVMSMLRTSDFATYESMVKHAFLNLFQGCTSLTKAPVLPATTLAEDCYSNMFDGCTSLTEAPVLPATTLDKFCYWEMFKGCTSLIKAPELPATTLGERCYQRMFEGCSSLNEVRCKMPPKYSSSTISSYAKDWLSNVSSTGTFYTNADANWPSGASGIPTSWNRVNT